jgi:hypothetical protein
MLQHTAAVVNSVRVVGVNRYTGERGDSEMPGTGCPMRWGKQRFVLSAAHVFENAEAKDIRVLVFADLPKEYKSREALTKRDIVDGIGLTDDSVIHRCKWEDLAVVTVDVAKFPGVDFIEPEKDWVDPPPGENVNCCGFPSDNSVIVNRRTVSPKRDEADLAVWPTIFGAPVLPFPSEDEVRFYFDPLQPDRHYLIPMTARTLAEALAASAEPLFGGKATRKNSFGTPTSNLQEQSRTAIGMARSSESSRLRWCGAFSPSYLETQAPDSHFSPWASRKAYLRQSLT